MLLFFFTFFFSRFILFVIRCSVTHFFLSSFSLSNSIFRPMYSLESTFVQKVCQCLRSLWCWLPVYIQFHVFYLCWTQCTRHCQVEPRWSLKYYNTSTIRFRISMLSLSLVLCYKMVTSMLSFDFWCSSLEASLILRNSAFVLHLWMTVFFTLGCSIDGFNIFSGQPLVSLLKHSRFIAVYDHHFTVCFTSRFIYAACRNRYRYLWPIRIMLGEK